MNFNKVGILGVGVMGEAMITGLIRIGFDPHSVIIREKRAERCVQLEEKYGVSQDSLKDCSLIFLAVKPQDLDLALAEIAKELTGDVLIISLLAGTTTSRIESALGERARVIRVMPNTPLLLGKGAAGLAKGVRATSSDLTWALSFFAGSGMAIEVAEEQMDAVTATSGSGPAYFFKLVESMISAASRLGMSESEAKVLASQTLIGAAKMVEESGTDVATLRANVTSPNGTTAAALSSLEQANFDTVIYEAMKAARDRSIELSK